MCAVSKTLLQSEMVVRRPEEPAPWKMGRRTLPYTVCMTSLVSVWEGEVVDADAPFSVVLLRVN